jgi:hypothetical protein
VTPGERGGVSSGGHIGGVTQLSISRMLTLLDIAAHAKPPAQLAKALPVAGNEGFLLGARPLFDLTLPLHGGRLVRLRLVIEERHGAAAGCPCGGTAGLVKFKARRKVLSVPDVIAAVRASQDIDLVWHDVCYRKGCPPFDSLRSLRTFDAAVERAGWPAMNKAPGASAVCWSMVVRPSTRFARSGHSMRRWSVPAGPP